MDDIPQEIPRELRNRILAGLLKIHSKRLEHTELKVCLWEGYDLFASLLHAAGWPLTEMLLTESIPSWLYDWAVAKKWFPYAPGRRITSHYAPAWPKEYVLKVLASRIAYWQAEALVTPVGSLPNSIPGEGTANAEGSSDGTKLKPTAAGRKRGPKPDYENARLVAEIVARIAPNGDIHANLYNICEALDQAGIPSPKKWRRRNSPLKNWQDGASDVPTLAKQAINDRLKVAKRLKNNPPEILL
jgi:hypothetical protein